MILLLRWVCLALMFLVVLCLILPLRRKPVEPINRKLIEKWFGDTYQ